MAQRSRNPCEREAGASPDLRLELQRNVRAPAIARAAVAGRCQDLGLGGSLSHTLSLLVSEVVSNAVVHSSGPREAPIELSATIASETIRIAVKDAGKGFTPHPRDPGRTHDGYGLYLLGKVASSWGVECHGATTVWFELPRSAPSPQST